jgi:hypothetical protein
MGKQYRSRVLTGSIGLEGMWSGWIDGEPEKTLTNRQYEYREKPTTQYHKTEWDEVSRCLDRAIGLLETPTEKHWRLFYAINNAQVLLTEVKAFEDSGMAEAEFDEAWNVLKEPTNDR